jgi:hypothetical protein
MVAILGNAMFGVGIELSNRTEMNVTTESISPALRKNSSDIPKNSDPNRFLGGQVLQLLDKPIPFFFVMSCRPVIIEVI